MYVLPELGYIQWLSKVALVLLTLLLYHMFKMGHSMHVMS